MKGIFIALLLCCCLAIGVSAQNVTIHAVEQPAASVFRSIIEQAGKNFVYSSDLLKDMVVTVDAEKRPLKKVLSKIFDGTDIEYRIKGNNVILRRKASVVKPVAVSSQVAVVSSYPDAGKVEELEEVVVVSRLEMPVIETSEIGAKKITADEIRNTPSIFGESDVIKTLQTQPGVTEGTEGMAGMYVHGGNADENQYMLDNIPLYQVNHFGGLFSAFNPEIIRYVDFFKSSVPAKYDGRLSSFMDVRLKDDIPEGHHGSARLGLTSGSFNISGPIGTKTSYLLGLRRSWYDVLTVPVLAIVNAKNEDQKTRLRYYFMDLNARINHRFNNKMRGFVSIYYGKDMLQSGSEDKMGYGNSFVSGYDDAYISMGGQYTGPRYYDKDHFDFNWGNLIFQTGVNYRFNPNLSSEFTAAYTRFFSDMKHDDLTNEFDENEVTTTHVILKRDNNISDWIFKGDFDWQPADYSRVRFGANYVRHSFLPARTLREYSYNDMINMSKDTTRTYFANEFNAYLEDDWKISDKFRINGGIHLSLFHIDGKWHYGFSPRFSASWRPAECLAVKAAYSHTVQYVHQLTQSYLSLPTDQWIPVTGDFKPQSADKISLGAYVTSAHGRYAFSVEGYWKRMYNLIDYRDEYYLSPPLEVWNARLTSGRGSAKGVDFKLEKRTGKLTGHIAYSLAWSDRTFEEKNGGITYPARFDNRHTINIVANWAINDKVQINAAWTGRSGNRFTFMPQMWTAPDFGRTDYYYVTDAPLRTPVNNYQLPFYHRLDLACNVKNSRGYWTFSLYNAYCHMNTIAIKRGYREIVEYTPQGVHYDSKPTFQKVKFLPVIPSISYTWQF